VKWALALLAAGLAAPATAQDLPVTLPDQATWTMTVERTRERTRQNAAPQAARSVSTTDVDWTAGADGGVVTLRVRSAQLDGPDAAGVDTSSLLDQPVVLEVDPSLAPTRIRNWSQVRTLLEQSIDKAVAEPAAASAAKKIFGDLSPELAAQVVSREWSLATLSQGTALTLGEAVTYEDALPNPLGGPAIKALGSYELQAYDAAAGVAVVAWKQAFDPKSASDSLGQALSAMTARLAPDKAKEAQAAFAGMRISREDVCRHEIDIPTGLALKVICTSAISTSARGETATNLDRWTITQTRPQSSAKTN
jgi:hypothetical protein